MYQAIPGDNIGINVKGIAAEELKRGDMVGHSNNPPTVVGPGYGQILGRVVVLWHPTSISAGYTPVMHAHTLQVATRFVKLLKRYGPKGEVLEEEPQFLKKGDNADVLLEPIKPSCIEVFKDFPPIGRFALRDMGSLIGVGVVNAIKKE